MISSETILANLFAIAQAVGQKPPLAITFCSRRWRMFKDVQPEQLPALFQFQSPTRRMIGGIRPLLKQEIRVRWMLYLPISEALDDVVSPALNQYCDMLIQAIQTSIVSPSGQVTLNGRVAGSLPQDLGFPGKINCYVDGDALTDEGLLATYSLLVLPITILVPGV